MRPQVTTEMKIYQSPETYSVPQLDLLTFILESEWSELPKVRDEAIIHADATNPDNNVTKGQLLTQIKQFAYSLRHEYGVGAAGPNKDVVVYFTSGQPLAASMWFGIIAAGGVVSGASHSFTANEVARQLDLAENKLLICSPDLKNTAVAAAKQTGMSLSRIVVLSSSLTPSLTSLDGRDVWSKEGLEWQKITDPVELRESLVLLLYSSGTTGPPKGVMISHLNLVASTAIPLLQNLAWVARQKEVQPNIPLRTVAHLPIAHIAGVSNYILNPALAAGTCYWLEKYEWTKFIEAMKRYQVTSFYTVPSIFLRISKSPDVRDHFGTVLSATTGASKMDGELQRAANKKLGDGATVFIGQTWGLSETTGAVTYPMNGDPDDTGSISPILPNYQLRCVDDDFQDVKEGQPGELVVKGDIVTRGYFKNPQATTDTFRDGWFCTGDIAINRSGKFYIVDRKKELLKYKGMQIAPAELEMLLFTHPKIHEAAVIGLPAEDGSDLPRAYVVPEQGVQLDEEEVKRFVAANLAPHKQLRGGVRFVKEIPKTPVGKMMRKELKAQALSEMRRMSRL